MNAILEVKNMTTVFGSKAAPITAVSNVSFAVKPGRVLGLVGESGSGKSVTARSVMRLLSARGRVTEGSVLFEGQDVLGLSEKDMQGIRGKDIAMVFQDPQSTLNPVMRVGNQIMETLEVHGVSKDQARDRARELLEHVGIPEPEAALQRYPHQFSGGMRQRVVIAIALAHKPKLLIADEPTTALDVTIQAQILQLLADLRHQLGIAVIMITHDIGVVAELCDDLVVMYGGRVVERGTVEDVFRAPRHAYTAALFSAMPSLDGDEGILRAIPGNPPVAGRLPSGCAFRDRCGFADDRCKSSVPDMVSISDTHSAACIRADETERDLTPAIPAQVAAGRASQERNGPILEVRNLKTDVNASAKGLFRPHNPIYAVDDISFSVFPGQTLGLVGESGCGKSTLSRTIVGINKISSGSIIVDGRDVTAMTDEDRKHIAQTLQYVFQDPSGSLNPRRTIGQSLQEALEIVGLRGDAALRRSEELVDQVGLSRTHLTRFPYELSGGQKQRVGIARALSVNPKVLICDEPVSALDVSIQAQIINLLAQLRDELNLGFLFIAHDLSVVRHISDQLAVMYLGRFVETGPAQQIYNAPNHPYTKSLLSAIPVADIDADPNGRIVLSGDMPSLANPPSGCRFRTRCPMGPVYAEGRERCIDQDPSLSDAGDARLSACHHWQEVAKAMTLGTHQ